MMFSSFPHADAVAFSNARFGPGTGPIHLDDVQCTGREMNITDCMYDPDSSDCVHNEDASIMCSPDCKYYCRSVPWSCVDFEGASPTKFRNLSLSSCL
jgi:hypothetical protein